MEDEESLAFLLAERLTCEGYQVETCGDGEQGLELTSRGGFDLVILDIMLPGKSGLEVCRELRDRGVEVPILMLTARGDVSDRVAGLKLGADDYLSKPFEVSELLARMEALLRRVRDRLQSGDSLFFFGEVKVDFRRRRVLRKGVPVELSGREFELLSYFIAHPDEVLSRDELLDKVWGYQTIPNTRTVDVHVAQLRQKLEENPKDARHIVTVYGSGYRFIPA
ncbi:MAG: response regulator transcription factor [Bryobacteraceae bacterium]